MVDIQAKLVMGLTDLIAALMTSAEVVINIYKQQIIAVVTIFVLHFKV